MRIHLSSSRCTQSQTVRSEGEESLLFSIEVHRRYHNNMYFTGCSCWKSTLKITGMLMVREILSDAWTGSTRFNLLK